MRVEAVSIAGTSNIYSNYHKQIKLNRLNNYLKEIEIKNQHSDEGQVINRKNFDYIDSNLNTSILSYSSNYENKINYIINTYKRYALIK